MNIRKAENSDIDNVARLVKSLSHFYLENGQLELPEWFSSTLVDSAFMSRFNDPNFFNFVAEIENKIVGYISIKSGFHLYHLFVSPDFHRLGIAKSLWQHMVNLLDIKQCTVRSSIFAIPVYIRLGFNVSGNIACKDGLSFQTMVYQT